MILTDCDMHDAGGKYVIAQEHSATAERVFFKIHQD